MILTHGANSLERGGDFVEIGGRRYPVVKIGNQLWITENLDWKWDGLVIGESIDSSARANYYNNDENTYGWNGFRLGLLYNKAAMYALSNLLTDGWHVPSSSDFSLLIDNTEDENNAAYLLSNGTLSWASDWTGVNLFGFNIKPSGQRYGSSGAFMFLTENSVFWEHSPYCLSRYHSNKFTRDYVDNNAQYSIRLVKDAT